MNDILLLIDVIFFVQSVQIIIICCCSFSRARVNIIILYYMYIIFKPRPAPYIYKSVFHPLNNSLAMCGVHRRRRRRRMHYRLKHKYNILHTPHVYLCESRRRRRLEMRCTYSELLFFICYYYLFR